MEAQTKTRMPGRVAKASVEGGYFFIVIDDGRQFFSHIKDTLDRAIPQFNADVEFTPVFANTGGSNPRAIDVRVIK